MADLRCPNCGKDNPDFLDVCQFCQTPLKPESMVHIGEKPVKKDTGELEPVLPEWLRDVRQQARDSAEEDAAEEASMPKVRKEEPPDLLAGLAFQSSSAEEEDVPDWLASLTSKPEAKPSPPAAPAQPESSVLDRLVKKEQASPEIGSEPQEALPWMGESTGEISPSPERDELSEWLAQASEQPAEPFALDPEAAEGATPISQEVSSEPQEEEDLSWLRSLEAESKRTGELTPPALGESGPSRLDEQAAETGAFDPNDLSWLDNLGALPASQDASREVSQPPSESRDDLSWLNAFPAAQDAPPSEPASPASGEDLGWLNDLGALPASEEPPQQPSGPKEDLSWLNAITDDSAVSQPELSPTASGDDLNWLDDLGGVSQPSQPIESQQEQAVPEEDLSWLKNLQGSSDSASAAPFADSAVTGQETAGKAEEPAPDMPHVSPFTPRRTAPLDAETDSSIPDWLKSATEEPSMPLGPQALEQFREDYKIPTSPEEPFSWKSFVKGIEPEEDQPALPASGGDSPGLSNQDVDSLFSMDMPDWLSKPEPESSDEPVEEIGVHAESGEALSPADLPSWVQAMRPVEAVISEAEPGMQDQPAEREGPLAGFRGVIPAAPIGSSRRPQPMPLKLQATDEHQAGAAILEQILLGETTPRPLVSAPVVISQRTLRWAIAALVLVVLGAVVFMRSQIMPVSPLLPAGAQDMAGAILNISEDAPVLVVLDYEPALAGEMEAVSGPILDQLVAMRHPHLSFLSTSPNGTALVERLLANTGINQADGYGYAAGQNYTNMGYLPGGESGVLAFIQSPQTAIPSSPVLGFSEYAAILLLTDHADSARVWVEQLHILKQSDPALAGQLLLAAASAQTGPLLRPYASSRQINGLISGLAEAASYEFQNNNRPGIARTYWDAFGAGIMLAVAAILLGSLWSIFTAIRSRRAEAAEE